MSRINCKKELISNSVWISCSGGVDSIAVAHYVLKKLKREVFLFHCNHRLRPQNDEMEESVRKFAADYKIPLEVWDLGSMVDVEQPNGVEALCRKLRLEGLKAVARSSRVIFAHHLNDCVESYLMNCFNGKPEYCPIPIKTNFDGTLVVRPFLLTPKKSFEDYADYNNLNDYVIADETNGNTEYRRNWVRNRALPIIGEHYPGLEKVAFKRMEKEYLAENYRDSIWNRGLN